MAQEIKKQLSDLWGKEPVQFHHFEFVTQDQLEKILNDTPRKYEKVLKSREQFPKAIYEAVNVKYSRTIDWISSNL